MPIAAKQDGNVPFIGPRSRYNLMGADKVWLRQDITGAGLLDGNPPARTGTVADVTDPTSVSAGRVVWDDLSEGGHFRALGKLNLFLTIHEIISDGGNTYTVVDAAGTLLRPGPTNDNAVPFVLAPGEHFKAVGGEFVEICAEVNRDRII